jgi:hypothetical protein
LNSMSWVALSKHEEWKSVSSSLVNIQPLFPMKQLIHTDNQFDEIIYQKRYVKIFQRGMIKGIPCPTDTVQECFSIFRLKIPFLVIWSFKFYLFCHFLVQMLQPKGFSL